MGTQYIGKIIDRMESKTVGKTKGYTTYEQAHHAAESLAKRKGLYHSDRYAIRVDDTEVPARLGRPRIGTAKRERLSISVDPSTAAAIEADRRAGESQGQVLDRWASERSAK